MSNILPDSSNNKFCLTLDGRRGRSATANSGDNVKGINLYL